MDVVAVGRDLRTGPDGAAVEIGRAELEVRVVYPERTVVRIAGDPPHPGLQALVGVAASAGFRQAVDTAIPGERTSRSVRFQLLDDLPTALLVSGYAIQAARVSVPRRGPMLQHPDLCAGWADGATLVSSLDRDGRPPFLAGPPAPSIETDDDPLAWHVTAPMPGHGMRRRRRIDVWDDGGVGMVECFFRDSHMSEQGEETVVHEYTVHATVDPDAGTFVSCDAAVGALPWPECPNAAASATRLVGAPVSGVRRWVRDSFVGPSTCTHLNDTLRSLEDVGALLTSLDAEGRP